MAARRDFFRRGRGRDAAAGKQKVGLGTGRMKFLFTETWSPNPDEGRRKLVLDRTAPLIKGLNLSATTFPAVGRVCASLPHSSATAEEEEEAGVWAHSAQIRRVVVVAKQSGLNDASEAF
eukprot:637856-Prymnesium_polylepis.1